jgi:hypothetical protein
VVAKAVEMGEEGMSGELTLGELYRDVPTDELTQLFIAMCAIGESEEQKALVREELKRRPIVARTVHLADGGD